MVESIVKIKSFDLAVSGVNFYKYIVAEKKEYIMSKQFLRCITSVGANVREAVNAQSKPDFIHTFLKMNLNYYTSKVTKF